MVSLQASAAQQTQQGGAETSGGGGGGGGAEVSGGPTFSLGDHVVLAAGAAGTSGSLRPHAIVA